MVPCGPLLVDVRSCGSQGRITVALGGGVSYILALCAAIIHGKHVNQIEGLEHISLHLNLLVLDLLHQVVVTQLGC